MKLLAIIASATLALAGVAWVIISKKTFLERKYELWKYPSIRQESSLSGDIKKEIELRKYNEAVRDYKLVAAKLDEAEAKGHNVAFLRAKMPRIARLISQKKYYFAKIHLNTVDVRIPRKKEQVRLAGDRDHNEGLTPDVKGSAQKVKRRKSKSRRGRRSKTR